MKVCCIASGSSGNCTYVEAGSQKILIDAGISRKRIVDGLQSIGVDANEITAVFVTHEHSDHIKGLSMMAKKYDFSIFGTAATLDGIRASDRPGNIKMEQLYQVIPDRPVACGDVTVMPYHISHDTPDPVGYVVRAEGHQMCLATDLGVYDDYTIDHLRGSEVLILEANHDISMLEAGPYPYYLKRRILSETGHLSNEATGSLLCSLMDEPIKHTFLAHLSKENNYPDLAYEAVKCQIWEEMGMNQIPFDLQVAKREEPSRIVTL